MPVSETQSTVSKSVDNGANSKETINSSQSSTAKAQFALVPYHTRNECNFSRTHHMHVSDLTTFQSWMKEGLTIRVLLQKTTFIKENDTTTTSRPASKTRPSSSKEKPPEKVNIL